MKRRNVLTAAAVALAGCASTADVEQPATADEGGERDDGDSDGTRAIDPETAESAFLERYNQMRDERGLAAVTVDEQLSEMGKAHAENMAEHGYIGHEQPDGTTIADRYRERGLLSECELPADGDQYYPGAENAAGAVVGDVTHPGTGETFNVTDADSLAGFLMSSWMSSDSHRRVMLLPAVRRIGLGVAVREDGEIFAALEFC
jgi:uncharacterized protein YkwD